MSLLDNLISHWGMDEASGTRFDSHGTNDLAENNSIAQVSAVVDDAIGLQITTSGFLSIGNNADLSTGDIDFTIASWTGLGSKSTNMALVSKNDTSGDEREYQLYYENSSDRFKFIVYYTGTGDSGSILADTLGSPSLNVPYCIFAWHDSVGNTLNIQVNDGVTDSVAYTNGGRDGTSDFDIGASNNGLSAYTSGWIDETSFWKRVTLSGERTRYYNDGDGLPYSAFGFRPHSQWTF